MALQTALLHKRTSAHFTLEPPIVIMYPHMLPQRVFPSVRLVADFTRVVLLTGVFNHVGFQCFITEKPVTALDTLIIPFHQMILFNMTHQ